jgi:hypothetical protein
LRADGRRWRAGKATGASIRTIVSVVSGFTLGHSLTLALASLGWIVVPTRLIEVLIAVSIVVSSLHAWRPLFAGKEIWIASAFGLIHGLAFAETLSGLSFDGWTLTLSLLGFNLGIESMQLLVILATLPVLLVLSQTACYALVRTTGAVFAAVCATGWIFERAFEITNPLQNLVDWLAAPPGLAHLVGVLGERSVRCALSIERARSHASVTFCPNLIKKACRPITQRLSAGVWLCSS